MVVTDAVDPLMGNEVSGARNLKFGCCGNKSKCNLERLRMIIHNQASRHNIPIDSLIFELFNSRSFILWKRIGESCGSQNQPSSRA